MSAQEKIIRKQPSGISIRSVVLLIAFVSFAFPLTAMWAVTYKQIFRNEISRVEEHHLLLAQSIADELERYNAGIISAFESFAPLLASGETPLYSVELLRMQKFKQVCVFSKADRKLVLGVLDEDFLCPSEISKQRYDHMMLCLESTPMGTAVSSGVQGGNGDPRLFVSMETHDALIVAAISTEYFRNLQSPITFGENAHLVIVDQFGNVLAHPLPEWERSAKNLKNVTPVSALLQGGKGVTEFFSPAYDDQMVVGYTNVKTAGWGVMVPQPLEELKAIARTAAGHSLWAFALGLVFAAAISSFLSNYLEKSVKQLSIAFLRVSHGKALAHLPTGPREQPIKELNELASRFNIMAERVQQSRLFEREQRDRAEKNAHLSQQLAQREAALRGQQERTAQNDRLEALGRLVGGVAHDYNNLLSVILGNAELAGEVKKWPDVEEFLDEIISASHRGSALTRQLLATGRRAHLEPETINVNEFLTQVVQTAKRLIPENIDLNLTCDPNLGSVFIDPNQLSAVMLNLISNARDTFGFKGGKIDVSALRVYLDNQELPMLNIVVIDNGHGMSANTLERAFEPFFTTKNINKGTGLGLSMAKGFIEQSGGNVDISSKLDSGTKVSICLPFGSVALDQSQTYEHVNASRIVNHPTKILLVEDEASVLLVIKRVLERKGYIVTTASSGDKAQDMIIEGLAPDLLISDIVMPGSLQGNELAQWALNRQPNLKVILTTGYSKSDEDLMASEAGVSFLSKPSSTDRILQEIGMLINESDA